MVLIALDNYLVYGIMLQTINIIAMFKEELKKQLVNAFSTRFFLAIFVILLSGYLVYNNRITSGDFATIIIAISSLYILGRSATGILGQKNILKNGNEH